MCGTARLKSSRHDISTVVDILFTLTRVHRRTKLPPCSRRLETVVSIAPACASTNSTLCTKPEASRSTMVAASTMHLRQRRSSHPSDPVLHRRRCAEAHGTRVSIQHCQALGVARRSAESVPAVQVFPLHLVTLDLNLSPASLQLVILELSLLPASLTSRSTRSIPSLPSSPHMTQANTKI